MNRIRILTLVLVCFCVSAQGQMVRVTGVADGRTIRVERGGRTENIRLAGVEVTDEVGARELLRWTVGSGWVLLEPAGEAWKVWRSPDALFVNEELVLRGFAKATLAGITPQPQAMVTYLGVIDPPAKAEVKPAREPRSGKGTSRRSSASPSPRKRSPRRAGGGR